MISAVGHQTDFTIADFVADVRAPNTLGCRGVGGFARSRSSSRRSNALKARLTQAARYKLATVGP